MLKISMNFARDIKTQNSSIQELTPETESLLDIFNTQKKITEDFLYSLTNSHTFLSDYREA